MKNMKINHQIAIISALLFIFSSCNRRNADFGNSDTFLEYAEATFSNIYDKYSVANENLLRENYPFSETYVATYLNNDSNVDLSSKYAYLWPSSGLFSAANSLYKLTKNKKYLGIIETKVLPCLEEYFDTERHPFAYASYINRAPLSDRFYDDNIWIGIDFTDLYMMTSNPIYLEKAQTVWNFVYSGHDNKLGGGIYWVEQNKGSKHSCSNAPAAVFALKLYKATKEDNYLKLAKELYHWTKENLQDKVDLLYYDNIRLDGSIDKKKYSYNSGQMIQAAALLYKITKEESYLTDAKAIAASCYTFFFHDFKSEKATFRILNSGDIWFSAVMARGFIELYGIDKNPIYLHSINNSLENAWISPMKDEDGLFGTDWEKDDNKEEKWLLTQAAMVEMYATFANPDLNNK